MNLEKEIFYIAISDIIPNKFRSLETYSDEELAKIVTQINDKVELDPIIVRKNGDIFELISGDKTYLAAKKTNLSSIPSYIRNVSDEEAGKVLLIDNLQNNRLSIIETATAYQTLMELDFLTEEELAENLAIDLDSIKQKLLFMSLIAPAKEALNKQTITEEEAYLLTFIKDSKKQKDLLNKVLKKKITKKELLKEVKTLSGEEINFKPKKIKEETEEKEVIETKEDIKPEIEEANLEQKIEETSDELPKEIEIEEEQIDLIAEEMNNKPITEKIVVPDEIVKTKEELIAEQKELLVKLKKEKNIELVKSDIIVEAVVEEDDIEEFLLFDSNEETMNIDKVGGEINADAIIKDIPSNTEEKENKTDIFNKMRSKIEDLIPSKEENKTEKEDAPEGIYDLRFAINNVRQAVQNTEKFGFVIKTEEFDYEDTYKIIINIDKNN